MQTQTAVPNTSNAGNATAPAAAPNLAAVKTKQQGAWSSGDYAVIGTTLQIVGEQLCESLDVRAGQKVLDVAAGNGNATLAAARRGCEVVSTDYVQSLLDRGRARAEAEQLAKSITFQTADAEALPFGDASFDHVVSTFGVMFTPDQDKAAAEMLRVCRPGGKIGMANWTPEGFIGQLFKTLGKHIPPAPGVKSPALWGTPERLKELFATGAGNGSRSGTGNTIETRQCDFVFRYQSPQHWLDTFRTWYGPVLKAFAALPADGQAALERRHHRPDREVQSGGGWRGDGGAECLSGGGGRSR